MALDVLPVEPVLPPLLAGLSAVGAFMSGHQALLIPLFASLAGAAFGAAIGGGMAARINREERWQDIQNTANVSIAVMIALMGKLLNFKKDQVVPAKLEADVLRTALNENSGKDNSGKENSGRTAADKISVTLELWAETPYALHTPPRLMDYTAGDLDVIQLVKMLDYNLHELNHLVRQRNALIQQMNTVQLQKGTLPVDRLQLYLRYSEQIAQNTDENLFFLDRAMEKIRLAVMPLLPRRLQTKLAAVALKSETQTLLPPKEFIKGWIAGA